MALCLIPQLGCATLARSNGILAAGYVLYYPTLSLAVALLQCLGKQSDADMPQHNTASALTAKKVPASSGLRSRQAQHRSETLNTPSKQHRIAVDIPKGHARNTRVHFLQRSMQFVIGIVGAAVVVVPLTSYFWYCDLKFCGENAPCSIDTRGFVDARSSGAGDSNAVVGLEDTLLRPEWCGLEILDTRSAMRVHARDTFPVDVRKFQDAQQQQQESVSEAKVFLGWQLLFPPSNIYRYIQRKYWNVGTCVVREQHYTA